MNLGFRKRYKAEFNCGNCKKDFTQKLPFGSRTVQTPLGIYVVRDTLRVAIRKDILGMVKCPHCGVVTQAFLGGRNGKTKKD